MSAPALPDGPYAFISYASADRARVEPIAAALRRAGVALWLDQQGIRGGENYGAEINAALQGCAALVLCCTAASLGSRNVRQEIALAWEYERPYLPLLLEPVTIPGEVRYWLTAAQWVEVLDRPEAAWLPEVLAALAPLGFAPPAPEDEVTHLPGREREQSLLRERLAAGREGRGGLVLIGGEAGVGKTALAEAALREARLGGYVVLAGRAFDLAETPPYGPWIDLFLHLPDSPDLPPPPPAFATRGTVGAVASQLALFAQVEDFLAALAAQSPAVVLLEDLHWADPASLDLLRFLARAAGALPLLLLATYRSDELTRRHPLYTLLPQLAREAGASRLDLRRLDADAVRALVAARYGLPGADTDRLAAYLHGRSEGNALFAGELLRSLEEGGALRRDGEAWRLGDPAGAAVPALLRQVIDARVARLDAENQRLLGVAAVIGHEVPLAVWAAVAEASEDTILAMAEQGLEARLLVEPAGDETVQFAHALIREALYEGLPGLRRRRLHRGVADALADSRSPDPDAVANHYQRAGDDRALPWLLKAGERAQAADAWVTAAARFEAALALLERADAASGERGWLLVRLARLLRLAEVPKARAFMDEAVALAAAAGDRTLAAYARYLRGMVACMAGDPAGGLPELEAGAAGLEALSEAERAHFAAHAAAIVALSHVPEGYGTVVEWRAYLGHFREARELGERLIAAAMRDNDGILPGGGDGYSGLGSAYAALGLPDKAATMNASACDAYRRAGDHSLAAWVLSRAVEVVALPYQTEDIVGRRRLVEQAGEEWARASGALPAAFPPRFLHLPLLMVEGHWAEAEQLAAAASAEVRVSTGYRTAAFRYLGALARLRGDVERARWAVQEGLPAGTATEPGTVATFDYAVGMQQVAITQALDEGDLLSATEWLAAHDRWLAWSGTVLGQAEAQGLWAQYHRLTGDTVRASEHARRALALASEPRQPLALLAAQRLLGELDTEAGRYDSAETHLAAALALAEACAAPYERVLVLLARAGLRAAMGDRDAALADLDEVRAICEPLGAQPVLARAKGLVAALAD